VTRVLQRALDSKRLVESDTQLVVKRLQDMGCKVFGLTKRWSDSAAETRRELLSMGMDFALSSPFPRGRKYCDECTESLLIEGVIYTNGHEKGPVLDRFLSQIIFVNHLKEEKERRLRSAAMISPPMTPSHSDPSLFTTGQTSSSASLSPSQSQPTSPSSLQSLASMLISSFTTFKSNGNSQMSNARANHIGAVGNSNAVGKLSPRAMAIENTRNRPHNADTAAAAAAAAAATVPVNLIFVDDLHENAQSVHTDLTVASLLSIPIYSCHYTAVRDQTDHAFRDYEMSLRLLCTEYGSDDVVSHSEHTDMEIYSIRFIISYTTDKSSVTLKRDSSSRN